MCKEKQEDNSPEQGLGGVLVLEDVVPAVAILWWEATLSQVERTAKRDNDLWKCSSTFKTHLQTVLECVPEYIS